MFPLNQGATPTQILQGIADGTLPSPSRKLYLTHTRRTLMCEGVRVDEEQLRSSAQRAPEGKMFVYECHWHKEGSAPCGLWVEGLKISMGRHLQDWHDVSIAGKQKISCLWGKCNKEMNEESIARHVGSDAHLSIKYVCSTCNVEFAREDAFQRHRETVAGTACRTATATILHTGRNVRVIDSRTAFGPSAA
ncbi:hypothetical protein BV22DRAFT_886295 [Leucogyrophana mollusca]|uniref:Uncharacterized protein n=1 Tax=Leucogyrophana mollusca TaxID=85980 RepID=A0ACB8B297_9AGAM|nr:hypothetical protein BV22DRAFT_886295 [Leucogyrophana mollusca]